MATGPKRVANAQLRLQCRSFSTFVDSKEYSKQALRKASTPDCAAHFRFLIAFAVPVAAAQGQILLQ
eukprot:1610390-Rhodomonas_salina.1